MLSKSVNADLLRWYRMKKILFAIAFVALMTSCNYDDIPHANTALECRQRTAMWRTEAYCLRDLTQKLQSEIDTLKIKMRYECNTKE